MSSTTLKPISARKPGKFSHYYRVLIHMGIKVLKDVFATHDEALGSATYLEAQEEGAMLKSLYSTGAVPQFFGVGVVKYKSVFQVGIYMEHLGDETLHSLDLDEDEREEVQGDLWLKLYNAGFDHRDLHAKNIMFYDDRYFAIDFSAQCIDTHLETLRK